MRDTVGITLSPKRAKLSIRRSGEIYKEAHIDEGSINLFYEVSLGRGESVQIPGKDGLEKLDGVLHVHSGPIGTTEDPQALGSFAYLGESGEDYDHSPACYEAHVLVTEAQFRELVDAARAGVLPSRIHVSVTGMKYRGAPDGSMKTWEAAASENQFERIREVSWLLPMPPVTTADIDDPVPDEMQSLTRADLRSEVDKLSKRVTDSVRSLWWAVVVIGVLVLIFKH